MASCSNDTSLCLDSEDEESFDAFGEDKDDSDIDLDGLEVEDDDTDLQDPSWQTFESLSSWQQAA